MNHLTSLAENNRYGFVGADPINNLDPFGADYDLKETAQKCLDSAEQSAVASAGDPEDIVEGCAFGSVADFADQEGCSACATAIEDAGDVIDLQSAAKTVESAADDVTNALSSLL